MAIIRLVPNSLNLPKVLSGGQSFRWKPCQTDGWTGIAWNRVWKLRVNESPSDDCSHLEFEVVGRFESSCDHHDDDTAVLQKYLRLEVDLHDLYANWSKADKMFAKLCKNFTGIRLLLQEPRECIFAFICSSNNNIQRISQMIQKLCENYGEKLEIDGESFYNFPSIKELAATGVEAKLRQLGFGYRARYVSETARKLEEFGSEMWLENLKKIPYAEAKRALMQLNGIGAKVADCICLMSLDHLCAVPIDTHVLQVTTKFYMRKLNGKKSLTEKLYNEIGEFYRERFLLYPGWAQTVLFCSDLRQFGAAKMKAKN